MTVKPPSPSNDNSETVILKVPKFGTAPDSFDADKTVIRPISASAAAPITPKPKGYSISFDHPEADNQAATGKAPSSRELPAASASSDLMGKRKPGAATSAVPDEAAPAKSGILKWILGVTALVVVFVLGVAYLIGSDNMAETSVTVLKNGTLIEPAQPAVASASPANVPAVAPETGAAPQPAPVLPPPPEPPPQPQVQSQVQPPVAAAAPAPNAATAPPGSSGVATPPKAPPDAAAVAAAAAKRAAREKERLAKQAQASTPVVTQARPPSAAPAPPPTPEPAPTPAQVAAPAAVAPPAPVAPSSPTQACEGRWLLAMQNCLTEQCAKPAFARHPVCVERREMDQRRQEQQRNR